MTRRRRQQFDEIKQAIDLAMAHGISQYGGTYRSQAQSKRPAGVRGKRSRDRSLLARHFTAGYGAQNYRPLSPQYAAWKRRFATVRGLVSDLVLTGELRHSVLGRGVIRKVSEAVWTLTFQGVPDHGRYQIERGRDWATPSPRDYATVYRAVEQWVTRFVIAQNRSSSQRRRRR